MQRSLLALVPLALVTPALTSCSLLGGGNHLDDALDLVPDGASQVVFRDRDAIAERLDLDEVDTGASEADLTRYAEAVDQDAAGPDDLTTYLLPMQDSELSELDVSWSVGGTLEEGAFTAYKLDDGVDLDAVADDLAGAGYVEDELRGRRHLELAAGNGEPTDAYPPSWLEVTVDPDEHLLVVGPAEGVLRVLDDEDASLGDNDTYEALLDDADDVQYALVSDPPLCGGGRATPAQLEASGATSLGSPVRTALLVTGDDAEVSARLEYADDDAAEADLEARRTYLDDGTLAATGEPVSSLGSFDLDRTDAVVRVALDLERPGSAVDVAQQGDGFLACTPAPDDAEDGGDEDGEVGESPSAPTTTAPGEPTVTAPSDDSTVQLP